MCLLMIMTADGGSQGGVCLVVWDKPQVWSVESTRFHNLNVVSYKVVTGTNEEWTPIMGSYLLHSTLEHLPELD